MYTKYAYNAGITQAQLLADLVLLLTGTTDKTTLSVGCDQVNTSIISTVAAGWTVYDAIAGTNAQVLRAPCDGDAAQYKYVRVSTASVGYVLISLYESWNSGTHVGTNVASNSDATLSNQRYATAASGSLYISASVSRIGMFGISSAGTGSSGNGAYSAVLECDRNFTWCAVGQGFVPAGFMSGGTNFYITRAKTPVGSIVTGSNSYSTITAPVGSTLNPMSGASAYAVAPHYGSAPGNSQTGVSGFQVSGVLCVTGGTAALDELTYNGKTYVFWVANLIVPKE